MTSIAKNEPAPGVSYYTPRQNPPAGTAIDPQSNGKPIPKLFQPLKIRGVTFQNRIFLSPLCQYSAVDGHLTDWHLTHLGGIAQRGPGMIMVEATSVTPEGRITPEDSGLWQDSQIEPLRRIVEFVHSQGGKIGIQLGHAGRKASTLAPFLSPGDTAFEDANGWPNGTLAPSAIPFSDRFPKPNAMTLEQIQDFKDAFVAATKRALKAGFDVIEIHSAHGYLLHEFCSPVSNQRTDQYGGSFENRTRLGLEIVDLVRSTIPEDMPLFFRISGTDWLDSEEQKADFPQSWTGADAVKLGDILASRGVDLYDVSTGGIHPKAKVTIHGPGYQSKFALDIKKVVGDSMAVSTVGTISNAEIAQKLLDEGLDVVFVGRWFQKNPGLVWAFADELGVEVEMPSQIRWAFTGRGTKTSKK